MASNFTPNIGLCQWQRTDPFTMDDFNADNAKIDAALGTQPYQVLLRQTLMEQSPRFSIDLSEIDFDNYSRIRLELSGMVSGPSTSGNDYYCLWCNDIATGYYFRSVGSGDNVSVQQYIQLGSIHYNKNGSNVLHLTADIMLGTLGGSFRCSLSGSSVYAEGFQGFSGYEYNGCCISLTPSTFQTLHFGPKKYADGNSMFFLPNAKATIFAVL